PCLQQGTAIVSAPDFAAGLAAGQRFAVDVANPCSGIRSLFALMMVGALFAHFTLKGAWRKWILFLCTPPLAVMGNLARILMLTIGTVAFGSDFALGKNPLEHPSWFHMTAGYLVFIVALCGMMGIGSLLNRDWKSIFGRWIGSSSHSPPRSLKGESRDTDRDLY
ncbi:MAG: exosortase/archaeosortase family protein, partial [Chthoniobacterales bacterium]